MRPTSTLFRPLLLLLLPLSITASEPEIRWLETSTHRIKIKLVDGVEVGRWKFAKKTSTVEPSPETSTPAQDLKPVMSWLETETELIKIAKVKDREVRRWVFPKKKSSSLPPSPPPPPAPAPALSIPSPSPGDESLETLLEQARMARANRDLGKAVVLLEGALARIQDSEADPLELASVLKTLGKVHVESNQLRRAEPLFLRALEVYRMAGVANSPQAADLHVQLAQVYGSEQQYQQAEDELVSALQIREGFHGIKHPAIANILYLLGLLSHEQGDIQKAESLYLKSLEMFQSSDSLNHPASLLAHRFYAQLLRDQDRLYEARSYERRAQEASGKAPTDKGP